MYKIATFNVRFDDQADEIKSWAFRAPLAERVFQEAQFDICGVQEPLLFQMEDMCRFGGFEYFGVGREDGDKAGEFTAVLYNAKRFTKLQDGHFWLSETPEQPSIYSGAMFPRICVWAQLEDRSTGRAFFVFNTHLSHVSEEARLFGMSLILERLQKIAADQPVVLMGDLNTEPDTPTYEAILKVLRDPRLDEQITHAGPAGSFHDFDPLRPEEELEKIDHLFVSPEFHVLKYATLKLAGEKYGASDHFPVVIEADLR
ncbi:endonuclease/exonuclease/phosphatase family protein [Listeria costaricensis]|uniref:endonuclease/exonuclease/phosphatase family protein n=1 Tax=Listeria costaricensis TaxID=2026604 RepID=UPI000C07CBCE|nr:endonuclease/exonuclease/phosphatase family protein [Listeria costaricensis]